MKLVNRLRTRIEKYLRHSSLNGILFKDKPVILTDKYGMRFVLYPWAHEPLEKLISRRYLVGEYEAISKILKPRQIVIDVGANIGTHSVYMSKCVGAEGKIYSFEPIPDTAWQLKENLALNKIENVEVIVAALKDVSGIESMSVFPSNFSAWNSFGTLETTESKPVAQIEVKTLKLDDFVNQKNINRIDFLKIDAEGSEKNVFMGAKKLFENGLIDVLSFEISQIPLKGMGATSEELFNFLNQYGYKSYLYDARAHKFNGPVTDSKVQCENYYASKRDLTKL